MVLPASVAQAVQETRTIPVRGVSALRALFAGLAVTVPFVVLLVLFMMTYVQNVPLNDQATFSADIAFDGHDGEFSMLAILGKGNGNRTIWSHLITYAASALTGWNISLETSLTLGLAALIFVTLLRLVWLDLSRYGIVAVGIISALVFSLNQQFNWLWALHNGIFLCVLFYVLAVFVLRVLPRGWPAVLLAALLCFSATFSGQQGLITWFVLPIMLWTMGYRSWKTYFFWAAASIFFIGLQRLDTGVTAARYVEIVLPDDLSLWVSFVLALLGAPIATRDLTMASGLGLAALGLLGVNSVFLGIICRRWRLVGTWAALGGFSVALAVVISLGRLEEMGIGRALTTWYITHTLLLWVAVSVLTLESVAILASRAVTATAAHKRLRWLQAAAVVALMATGLVYAYSNYAVVQSTARFFDKPFGSTGVGKDEECLARFPLTGITDCFRMTLAHVPGGLVHRQLAVYGQPTSLSLLPADYTPDDVIVFDSVERSTHRIIDSLWFPQVKTNVIHLVAEEHISNPEVSNRIIVSDLSATVSALSADQVWYLNANGNTTLEAFVALMADTYTLASTQTEGRLIIARFKRIPAS